MDGGMASVPWTLGILLVLTSVAFAFGSLHPEAATTSHKEYLTRGVDHEYLLHPNHSLVLHVPKVPAEASGVVVRIHCGQCSLTFIVETRVTWGSDVSHVFRRSVNGSGPLPRVEVLFAAHASSAPVLLQASMVALRASDVVPGGCGSSQSPGLSVYAADQSVHVDLSPAQTNSSSACGLHDAQYLLYVLRLTGASNYELFAAIGQMRSPWNVKAASAYPGPTRLANGTLRFVVAANRMAGYVYNVVASFRGQHAGVYVPSSFFPCSLDSASPGNETCQGLLHSGQVEARNLAPGVPTIMTYGQSNGTEANTSSFVIFQAHSQRTKVNVSFEADPASTKLSKDKLYPGLDASVGLFLSNASGRLLASQYAISVAHSSAGSRVPVHVSATVASPGAPVPGGCGPSAQAQSPFYPLVSLSADSSEPQSTSVSIAAARPSDWEVSACSAVPEDRFTYKVYRAVLSGVDVFSVEAYLTALDQMATVAGILNRTDAELLHNITNASMDAVSFPYEIDAGVVYGVVVSDNALSTSVAYVPSGAYHCSQYVSPVLQYGSPCKVMLNRTDDGVVVPLVNNQVMTLHIDPSASEAGFAVVQTHSQLHRVRASTQLEPMLKPPASSVAVSRSTGVVVPVVPNGQFDYFTAMYAFVEANAQVNTVFYPYSAPLPGGCCKDCKQKDVVAKASAPLVVTFNETLATVDFNDAAILLKGEWHCAYLAAGVRVTYDLYALSLNSSRESDLFDGLQSMSTVEATQRYGEKVRSFSADSDSYSASFPVQPGRGRVYGVVVSLTVSDGASQRSASAPRRSSYVPASSYDCAYVSSRDDNDGQICQIVLAPNQPYLSSVNASSNLSLVLNDWDPSAAKWTFVIMSAHTQRTPVLASLDRAASRESAFRGTSAAVSKLLSVSGDNEHAVLYVSQAARRAASDNTNVLVVANPYTQDVPIPGACCLTCSLDIDANVNVSFFRYTTIVSFHSANIGYKTKSPPLCYTANTPVQARLKYYLYKYEMNYADFAETSLFDALGKMSSLAGVLQHGKKMRLLPTSYTSLRHATLTSARGTGTVYNILVVDPENGEQSVYSPSVSYGCDLNGKVLGCDSIGLFGRIVLTLSGLIGVALVLFGHRLYIVEVFLCSLMLVMIFVFPLVSVYTSLAFTGRIAISLVCGLAGGALSLYARKTTTKFRLFIIALALPPGFLFAGLLFFTPFGNLSAFHSPPSYWLTFLAIGFWFPVGLLYFPVKGNLLSTSWMGGYAVILAVNQYVDTQLVFIVKDVILHAVESQSYTKNIYHDYTLSKVDIGLCALWALLTLGGGVFQYHWLKRRDLLVMPLSDVAYLALWRTYQLNGQSDAPASSHGTDGGRDDALLNLDDDALLIHHDDDDNDDNDALLSAGEGASKQTRLRASLDFFKRRIGARQAAPSRQMVAPGVPDAGRVSADYA